MSPGLFVGTYARNGGAGLHPLTHADAGWVVGEAYAGAQNASFGTYSARHGLYYFVDEQAEGSLGAFRLTGDGWRQLARVGSQGAGPCYVALDRAESCLAIANYASGSVALFLLDEDTGVPLEPPVVRRNAGKGANEGRQDGPHAHCVCFSRDQRWVYQVDLGTDEILAYSFDANTGALGERNVAYQAPPGSGPRHLVFHPVLPFALLVSELSSTMTLLQVSNGRLTARQEISTLPPDYTGESLGGHLSVDQAGECVYVTNRGHDSIAVFGWNELGALQLLQHVPSGGASPRSFVLLEAERQLLLVNEKSGIITAFDILPDGTLSVLKAEIEVPGAVFLLVAG